MVAQHEVKMKDPCFIMNVKRYINNLTSSINCSGDTSSLLEWPEGPAITCKIITPKLNTSYFIEIRRFSMYSGGMYPLHNFKQ